MNLMFKCLFPALVGCLIAVETKANVFDSSRTDLVSMTSPMINSTSENSRTKDLILKSSSPVADFDLYVFAQSWQPAFCRHKETEYPGCSLPHLFWKNHFTIHGLWPDKQDGSHPGFCYNIPFNKSVIVDIGLDVLLQYWPNVKVAENMTIDAYLEFWQHEWERHGTCSGLDQETFFRNAILLEETKEMTPDFIQSNVGKRNVDIQEIYNVYGGKDHVVLVCIHSQHANILAQVYTCWNKDENHIPTNKIPCPPHILQENTCARGKTVDILAFGTL